jgi:ATP-binding cassette subfamily F protein 3
MIAVHDLKFSYGAHLVFEKVGFSVPGNWKVGLAGPNGAGKSTLLGLILGKEKADSGKIEVVGNATLVPQEVKHDPIMESSESIRIYLDPTHKFQDFEILKMLSGLELEQLPLDGSPKKLSGGQKTKLALARALLSEPDILLLDEPTNFMDVAGKVWVMEFLSNYPKTVVLISHDLELMDKSIDKVLFVNPQTKLVEEYKGNYTDYLRLKAEHEALLKRQYINEKRHIARMEEGLKKLQRNTSAKGVRQRVMLRRRIEKVREKLPELPRELETIKKIDLPSPAPVGATPIKASHLFKSYGETPILEDVDFYVERGERIALIGPNGAGKTTLIKILVGSLEADSGSVIKDDRLKLGYYSQEFETFDLEKTVLENIMNKFHESRWKLSGVLDQFLIDAEKQEQTVASLSGGEKTRLSIAMLLLDDYNLLVLDEPTTYLDVMSQRIILEALKKYTGAMLIVSHTEEFIKELKPRRALILPENVIDFWSEDLVQRVSEV